MTTVDRVLAIYCAPPGHLSLVPIRHDHNASLWRIDGTRIELERYWEFERISGLKNHGRSLHDPATLAAFVDHLLRGEGLTRADVSSVWGTPGIATGCPHVERFSDTGLPMHSLAHLFCAIAMDTEVLRRETIVGLALDGGPDLLEDRASSRHWYAGCVSRAGEIEYVGVQSPGRLWVEAGRKYQREPGTLMALASAATCAVELDIPAMLAGRTFFGAEDGVTAGRLTLRFHDIVAGRLGDPAGRAASCYDARFSSEDNIQSAVMKLVQQASISIVEQEVARLLAEYDVDPRKSYLALSGGYALNCPTNSTLMDRFGFLGLLAPPCPNDSGQSMGVALLGLHAEGRLVCSDFALGTAFHGNTDLRLAEALATFPEHVEDVAELDERRFVLDLINGPVAWVNGAAEIGPRALGHRSLLGDPRRQETKDRLNEVKRRQWWRPVAPVVQEDRVAEWFENTRRSPYMLEVFRIRADRAGEVPAIVHLDGTARVQTLAERDDPLLYAMMSAFDQEAGVPLLANTSLNDKGEPIVDDAVHAINFCVRKGISVLYVGGRRIQLRHIDAEPTDPAERYDPFVQQEQEADWKRFWTDWLAQGHSVETLFLYTHSPDLRRLFPGDSPPRRLDEFASRALRLNATERAWVRHRMNKYSPDLMSWPPPQISSWED